MGTLSDVFYEDLSRLLSIRSVNGDCGPTGPDAPLGRGVAQAIEAFLAIGRRMGFHTVNLDGYAGYVQWGDTGPVVAILTHLDTVPAGGEWAAPPFALTRREGKLYGRGVCDDKGPALVSLYAMQALRESGYCPTCRVRLIVGGDEESGGNRCLARYKKTEEAPVAAFSPDGDFPLIFAEKGILRITLSGTFPPEDFTLSAGTQVNVVPSSACAHWHGETIRATGVSAHAMAPSLGVNALLKLGHLLRERGADHPLLRLLDIASTEGLGICFSDELSGPLTFNPAIAELDETGRCSLQCDIRVPVTVNKEAVVRAIRYRVQPLGFTLGAEQFLPPLHVPQDGPLVTALLGAYRQVTGDMRPPVSSGGATYAREFPNAVAFGMLFPGEEITFHRENECWSEKSLQTGFDILTEAIRAVCRVYGA